MDDKELYKLAKAGDPAAIPGLLNMITQGALEILRLQNSVDVWKNKHSATRIKHIEALKMTKRLATVMTSYGSNRKLPYSITPYVKKPVPSSE